MTDFQKAMAAQKILIGLAASQPARNNLWLWATEACEFPTVALAMIYDAFHQEGGK